MRATTFILYIFFICAFASAQNPLQKQWDARFGGSNDEWLTCFQQTADGGYILGGYSFSGISGDKTQSVWGGFNDDDYWIVKVDSLGNKQWDKRFGGTDKDELTALQQTSDGGYILGGCSFSQISGNKTQANWDPSGQTADYWIVKIDSVGNKLWDKRFGGTGIEFLYAVRQTRDGGYILGGYSCSAVGGDKSQSSWGVAGADYWIVKTDSAGVKEWDARFGGMMGDALQSLQQTTDGGYILGGLAQSGIGGDKTQPSQGGSDYWIVKTDSLGIMMWDKDFGGDHWDNCYSVVQTSDGGYLLGGHSGSGISGDKTESNRDSLILTIDYWIVKTDANGNKQWDRTFGGTKNEEFGLAMQTSNGGYIVSGTSYSDVNGDKTEANVGNEQSWYVKTDPFGNKQWDEVLQTFSMPDDEVGLIVEARDGCYVMANFTTAGQGADKSQPSRGGYDYWIIKFCDTTSSVQSIFSSDQEICPGTCIDFASNFVNGTTYQWYFPGAVPDTSTMANPVEICYNSPGSYAVTLIANNSTSSDTLFLPDFVTVYPFPLPQSITQFGDTLVAIAGNLSFQWYFNGNIINGATNYFYIAPASGDYNVIATDTNGCEVEAAIYNVIASAEFGIATGLEFEVFPNPVEARLGINYPEFGKAAIEISIYNMTGEKQLTVDLPPSSSALRTELDVNSLPSGTYLLEIRTGEKTYRNIFLKR